MADPAPTEYEGDEDVVLKEVKGGTKRGSRKLFNNRGYSYVHIRTNGKWYSINHGIL